MKKFAASLFLPEAPISVILSQTSAWLFSEQKLMTLILNIAFNTQIKSNQIKQCDHTWGKLAIDHALSDKMTTASSSKSNFYFKQEISLIN